MPGVLGRIGLERASDYAHSGEVSTTVAQASERPGFSAALLEARVAAEVAGQLPLAVIAEVKRSSPSQGAIAPLEPVAAARAYRSGGAAALSVLTEPRHFGGDLSHLRQVAAAVGLPLLRKEFTVHPQQVLEAAEGGASAVLLIVALLGERTAAYLAYARALGLDALVEVHDEAELEIALGSGAQLIGVNNRDLRTLEIDLNTAPRLIAAARTAGFGGVAVAESGYRERAELDALAGVADAVLVGTSLAGSGDLTAALLRLRGA